MKLIAELAHLRTGRAALRFAGGERRRFTLKVPRMRTVVASAAALGVGVCGAVLAASGSYAYLNSQAPVGANTSITAGTSTLALAYASGTPAQTITIPNTAWATMLPGDFVGQQVTLTNSGDTGITVTSRLAAAIGWEVRTATGTCPVTLLPSTALTTTATSLTTLASGASTTLCVQLRLPTTAAAATQGTTANFSVVLDGTQS